jgi:hypothetical protein
MRPVTIVGWVLLAAGVVVFAMRGAGLHPGQEGARVEMVSAGATIGDDTDDASLRTAPAAAPSGTAQVAIISMALGILFVVIGNPGAAPSERRLLATYRPARFKRA